MYSFKITLLKGIKYFVLFGLPVLVSCFIQNFPWIAQLTVGGILTIICDFLKHKYGLRLP
ncbi:hypothetical protein M0R01_04660 [bacterium]|jgi:hypothetical protein|nr:hypothetical protein [bacterium]MCK9578748.1 hypothetical protein [bacterium]